MIAKRVYFSCISHPSCFFCVHIFVLFYFCSIILSFRTLEE